MAIVQAHWSDEELLQLCRQGQEDAWVRLVGRYDRLVYSILRKFPLPEQVAGEIFDEVFTELWRSLHRLENPHAVGAWVGTVTQRRCLTEVRRQRRLVSLEPEKEGAGFDPVDPRALGDTLLLEAELQQRVREAMETLPERCRRLFEWLFYTDPPPSYEAIGRRLGIARNSVGFVRGRCLEKLRVALDDADENGSAPLS